MNEQKLDGGKLILTGLCCSHYYTIYSTMLAFYLPLVVIVFIYTKIFITARRRIRKSDAKIRFAMALASRSVAIANGSEFVSQSSNSSDVQQTPMGTPLASNGFWQNDPKSRKQRIVQSREKRALRTTIIITGSFICSWFPFFLNALLSPFCPWCAFPHWLASVTLWLGYMSVFVNPLIYTVFSPDFRLAFRRILFKFRQ